MLDQFVIFKTNSNSKLFSKTNLQHVKYFKMCFIGWIRCTTTCSFACNGIYILVLFVWHTGNFFIAFNYNIFIKKQPFKNGFTIGGKTKETPKSSVRIDQQQELGTNEFTLRCGSRLWGKWSGIVIFAKSQQSSFKIVLFLLWEINLQVGV